MDPRTVSRRYVMAGTGLFVPSNLVCSPQVARNSHGAGYMSEEGAHTGSPVPIAASLAEFTDELVTRRGVQESNALSLRRDTYGYHGGLCNVHRE